MSDLNKEIQQDIAIMAAVMTSIVTKAITAKLAGQPVQLLDNHETAKEHAFTEKAAVKKAPAKAAAKKAAPKKEEPAEVDEVPDIDEKPSKQYTDEDVRKLLQKAAKDYGAEKSYEILGEFNAKKVADLKKSDYAAVIEKLESLDSEAQDEDF